VKEGYFNKEQLEEDFPGMLDEQRKRYEAVDSSTASILAEKEYTPSTDWCWADLPVYSIKLDDLLPVRSAVYCRRKASYRYWIREAIGNSFTTYPLICYLQTDGVIRVKYGNLLYWVAKETRQCESYNCVFPGGPEETDDLYRALLKDLKMNEVGFC